MSFAVCATPRPGFKVVAHYESAQDIGVPLDIRRHVQFGVGLAELFDTVDEHAIVA